MTPITPKGTLTLLISKPFGLVQRERTRPSGEGSEATLRMSDAIASSLPGVRRRRSLSGFPSSILSQSILLADRIASASGAIASASARRISFRFASESLATSGRAALASLNICEIIVTVQYKDSHSGREASFHGHRCARQPLHLNMPISRRLSACRRDRGSGRCPLPRNPLPRM